jgi:iron complex transport system ATP-binding protein
MAEEKHIAIRIQALQAKYSAHYLYENFDFQFEYGQLYGLLGNNGTGKSTLLKQIAGLKSTTKNSIYYGIADITGLSAQEIAKKRFYIRPQSFSDKNIKVADTLALALPTYHLFGLLSKTDKTLMDESLNYFSILNLRHKKLSEISDGEFQKVMLSMAYVSKSAIIILDEPTAFLDFSAKKETFNLLKKMCMEKNKCIIVATHDIYQLIACTDQLLMINNQRVEPITKTALLDNLSTL